MKVADAATGNVAASRQYSHWLFRLLALLAGMLPLVLLELICRFYGWGRVDPAIDPFVGFASTSHLFEPDPSGQFLRTVAAREKFFRSVEFPVRKSAEEFRIFVFGGSTVQGRPWSIETSFPAFLEAVLSQAQPQTTWKVINCGGVSYASYRLLPIIEECTAYHPDLFILCTGQNEFLEDTSWSGRRQMAPILQPFVRLLTRLHFIRAAVRVGQQAHETPQTRPVLPAEVLTRLDQSNGLERFQRDDRQAGHVHQHFAHNLNRIAELCSRQKIPLLLIRPPVNLSDCPPFKSEFSGELQNITAAQILEQLRAAQTLAATDRAAAIQLAENCVRTDPRSAISWYELGQLQLLDHRYEQAAASLQQAVNEDLCPLRMTSQLEQQLQSVARSSGIPLLNAHELLAQQSRGGIPGGGMMVDHVHPSFRGHEEIALMIFRWMQDAGHLQLSEKVSEEPLRQVCRDIVQSLDDSYYLKGLRTLQSLKLWAAGRAFEPILVDPENESAAQNRESPPASNDSASK